MSDIKQIIETLNGLKRIQPKIIEKDIDEAIGCIELLRAYENRPNDKYWYEQGKADQKEEDNKFFNFEGAWELEKQKIKQDGAREFAEWLDNDANIGIYDYYGNKISAIDLLSEWQKSKQ